MLEYLIVKCSNKGKSVQYMLDLLIQHKVVSVSTYSIPTNHSCSRCVGMGHKYNWYNIFTSSKDGNIFTSSKDGRSVGGS